VEKTFKAYDFNGSGGVTKDELIWARKMKRKYLLAKAEAMKKQTFCIT
jgi:hypothetical protein